MVVVVRVEVLSGRREECGEELEFPCTVAMFLVELVMRAGTIVPRSLAVGAVSAVCGALRVADVATWGVDEVEEAWNSRS